MKTIMAKNLIACDFDGTINYIDIGKTITKSLFPNYWKNIEQSFKNGELNNYKLYCDYILPALKTNNHKINKIISKNLRIAPGFIEFYEKMSKNGSKLIILSDGFDKYIKAFLEKYNLKIDFYANKIIKDATQYSIKYPFHCHACSTCGTCKTFVLKKLKKHYENIIYIGDGVSDICPSFQSNIFFAKRKIFNKIQKIEGDNKPAIFYLYDFHRTTKVVNILNKVKCVIFDLDGTLVDGFDIIYESFNYALKKLGLKEVPKTKIKKVIGPALSEGFRRLVPENLVERGVTTYREYYKGKYLQRTVLFQGITELLTLLKDREVIVGMITNKKGNFAKDLLDHLGLSKFFDFIIGAEEGFLPKPEGEVINHIIERYRLSKQEIVYIGDSTIDGEFSKNSGISFIAVGMGLGKERELYKYKPLTFSSNTKELTEVLDKIVQKV